MTTDSPHRDEVQSAHNRRAFLGQSAATLAAAGAAANLLAPESAGAQQGGVATFQANADRTAAYSLPKLPYAYNALEPYIDAKTMEIHHTKHHQAYLDKLVAALKDHPDLMKMLPAELLQNLDAIPEDIRTAVRNNGGGHVNHSQFWRIMRPGKAEEPKGALADAINAKFGDLNSFKEAFANAAATQFGSGWAWLVKSGDGVEVMQTANQDSPWSQGKVPIIGVDVWEHAYYLKYQNKRPDYVAAWWNTVNWDEAANYFGA